MSVLPPSSSSSSSSSSWPKIIVLVSSSSSSSSNSSVDHRDTNTTTNGTSFVQQLQEELSVSFGMPSVGVLWVRFVSSAGGNEAVQRLLGWIRQEEEEEAATSKSGGCILVLVGDPKTELLHDLLETHSPFPFVRVSNPDSSWAALEIARWASLSCPFLRTKIQTQLQKRRQASVLETVEAQTRHTHVPRIRAAQVVTGGAIHAVHWQPAGRGKVRDSYLSKNGRALVTTDRQSGFDRHLCFVPYKGRVLNLTAAYWFQQTSHIIPNHVLAIPHPNVAIVRNCQPFPIEFVVRAYLTGSTATSIWKHYQDGVHCYCGHELPHGMRKNQKLPHVLLTPTTKEELHDRPLSEAQVLEEEWMTVEDWNICSKAALELFAHGQSVAAQRGLILVDTKYEFGKDENGQVYVVDEMHTPDSSRFWIAHSYQERLAQDQEPENIDKEFLRLWFRQECRQEDLYNPDATLPPAPVELVTELSRRYIFLYEVLTGQSFNFVQGGGDGDETMTEEEAIGKALETYYTTEIATRAAS